MTFYILLLELIITCQECVGNVRICPGTNAVQKYAPVQRMVFHMLQHVLNVVELVLTILVKRTGKQQKILTLESHLKLHLAD